MTHEEVAYIRYRMERASHSLRAARRLHEDGELHDAVNRLYYACFYAVAALLLTEGMESRKHKGVRSLFDQQWIKVGRMPIEMGRFFHQIQSARLNADYEDLFSFSASDIERWLNDAESFIATIAGHVDRTLQDAEPSQ
jgi:uncharacterized protein